MWRWLRPSRGGLIHAPDAPGYVAPRVLSSRLLSSRLLSSPAVLACSRVSSSLPRRRRALPSRMLLLPSRTAVQPCACYAVDGRRARAYRTARHVVDARPIVLLGARHVEQFRRVGAAANGGVLARAVEGGRGRGIVVDGVWIEAASGAEAAVGHERWGRRRWRERRYGWEVSKGGNERDQ